MVCSPIKLSRKEPEKTYLSPSSLMYNWQNLWVFKVRRATFDVRTLCEAIVTIQLISVSLFSHSYIVLEGSEVLKQSCLRPQPLCPLWSLPCPLPSPSLGWPAAPARLQAVTQPLCHLTGGWGGGAGTDRRCCPAQSADPRARW